MRDPNGTKNKIMRLPLADHEATSADLRPFLPSEADCWYALLSSTGRVLVFTSNESGKPQAWVAELRSDGDVGRPVMVKTRGIREIGGRSYAWAPDGKSLYVVDERERLQKVSVTLDPQLAVSAPVEVADLEQLRIQSFAPISDGRFLVSFKPEIANDITSVNLVLNWTEILKKKVPVAK